MRVELKGDFKIEEQGTWYKLPKYQVTENGLEELEEAFDIKFVRGSKSQEENVERVDGILHEDLLAMIIEDLSFKNNLVRSRETSLTITKLEEALHWLRQRSIDRQRRGVQGTYKN